MPSSIITIEDGQYFNEDDFNAEGVYRWNAKEQQYDVWKFGDMLTKEVKDAGQASSGKWVINISFEPG